MPRKRPKADRWQPPRVVRRGKEYVRFRVGPGKYREQCLGPAGSAEARAEYLRVLGEMEARRVKAAPPPKNEIRTIAVLNAYRRARKHRVPANDYARIRTALATVEDYYGRKRAAEFGPLALAAVRQVWVREGYCRRTISKYLSIVRRCFRWAVAQELIEETVWRALLSLEPLKKGEAPDPPRIPPADLGDVEKTLPHLPPTVADMVRLQLAAGMRPGEVCAIRPCDVGREWKVIDGVAVWLYKLDSHKTDWRGQFRWIPLGPQAQAILRPYLLRPADSYCFSPAETAKAFLDSRRKERPVPRWKLEGKAKPGRKPTQPKKGKRKRAPGERYRTEVYDRCVSRACERAGVDWSPNQLRHTAGTRVQTVGSQEDARVFLGHRTPTVTAVYAEQVERAAKVAARLG